MEIPTGLQSLPTEGERDNLTVVFREVGERIHAIIYDDFGMAIDVIRGEDFLDAYQRVRVEYPQAYWQNPEDEIQDEY